MDPEADNKDMKPAEQTQCCQSGDNMPSQQGIFLPVAILMVAVLLFLGWELYLTKSQGAGLQKAVSQREAVVNRARSIKTELNKIVGDLLAISGTNPDAKFLVQKYQIGQEQKR